MSPISLPPGFRFQPTDEELIVHFLQRKAAHLPCHPDIIPDVELYRHDPWELNGKALEGENQWYFFTHRTQDQVTSNGYWKPINGADDTITSGAKSVGIKKSLIFYIGKAPVGIKTNWVMHEYHLLDCSSSSGSSKKRGKPKMVSNDWVLCRVCERDCGSPSSMDGTELSCLDEVFLSLDDLDEISLPN